MRRGVVGLGLVLGLVLGWYTSGSVEAQPGYGWPGLGGTYTWTGTHDYSSATLTVPASFTAGSDTVDFATGQAEDEVLTYNAATNTWASEPAGASITIGTLNTVAKFAAADLADSSITDDGSTVDLTVADVAFTNGGTATYDAAAVFAITTPVTNTSFYDFTGTVPIIAAAETVNYMDLSITSTANHTGGNLNGIYIGGITADAQATEAAINIADGWDYAIAIPDGGAADNAIALGDSADAEIYFDGTILHIEADNTASHNIYLQPDQGGILRMVGEGGIGWIQYDPYNAANTGFDIFEIEVTAVAATNGSDIVNMLFLDWSETDWATDSETLNGLKIDGITQDAQGTYNAINIGDAWDEAIYMDVTNGQGIMRIMGAASREIDISYDGNVLYFETEFTGVDFKFHDVSNNQQYVFETGAEGSGEMFQMLIRLGIADIGLSVDVFQLALNGSDTQIGIDVDFGNQGAHTGVGNVVYGINVDDITGDAQARETGVNVKTGWDVGISSANHIFQRENFQQGFRKQLASDFSAATDTDGSVNIVLGTNGVNFEYREEQDKTTSSFILDNAGAIDISADNTVDNEGVEFMLGSSQTTTSGYLVAQTDQLCFSVNAKVTLIAGTDQFVIGWRVNSAYDAANVYTNYSDYNVVGINNVDGSVFGLSDSTTGAAETDDSGTNWANGETKTLKACIDGAGLPHGYLDGTLITETNRTTAMDAGTMMVPFISYLQAGGATDAAILINWWEITAN